MVNDDVRIHVRTVCSRVRDDVFVARNSRKQAPSQPDADAVLCGPVSGVEGGGLPVRGLRFLKWTL